MNNKLLKNLGLIALCQLGLTCTLQAAIFKCVSVKGSVFYNDKPCPIDHEQESLKHIKDPKSSTEAPTPAAPVLKKTNLSRIKLNKNLLVDTKKLSTSPPSKKTAPDSKKALTSGNTIVVNNAKSRALDKNNLPKSVDINNIKAMRNELADSLSQLKMF